MICEALTRVARGVPVLALATAGAAPGSLAAQEGGGSCDRLVLSAAREVTREGTDYLWGAFNARCGDASMSADSAVVRERFGLLQRARLLRNVRYQDSTRSLTSDSLTYSGANDRVVAIGKVVLTMRKSGARLSGPRVEFHRLTRAGAERTVATDRPRLVLDGEPGSAGPPTTIDADRMEVFREESAWNWGDVVIRRPDAVSYADSSFFDMENGIGVLHGAARVEGDDFELRGDSIRVEFTEDELRTVHAFHAATAAGEDFSVASEQIRIHIAAGEVEEVVAFGSRSGALSEGYHLLGDSLRFRLREGAMDSTFAVGSAVAVEDTTAGLGEEPTLSVDGDAGWLAGDTIVASFRRLAPADTVPAPGPEAAAAVPAVGPEVADSLAARAAIPDSMVGPGADGAADAESAGQKAESELEQLRTIGNARAFYVAADTTGAGDPPARNYLIGDQIAVFVQGGRVVRVAAERAIGVYLDPDPNAVVPPEPERRGDVAADSLAVEADEAPADSAVDEREAPEEQAVPEKPLPPLRPGDGR